MRACVRACVIVCVCVCACVRVYVWGGGRGTGGGVEELVAKVSRHREKAGVVVFELRSECEPKRWPWNLNKDLKLTLCWGCTVQA